jgi:two-component system CheB/CheR fusion protein
MSKEDSPDVTDVGTPPQQSKEAIDLEDDGHTPFPIVGVGASAGGLEAFQQLLSNLPQNTGMAFVLVQHLDPHHESRLTDVLSKSTGMPIVEATHGLAVQPNRIYIIPPNCNLAIDKGVLAVTPRPESRGPHLPVDYLFRSLARDQKARAVGVILSGTGSDGTQGLCEIKAVGGITFAQDEKSAKFNGMPHNAAEAGCADFILPPDEIAHRIAEIGGHPYLVPTAPAPDVGADGDAHFRLILARVRKVTGVDFSLYRDTTIKRRIMRRMALHTQDSLASYVERLENDPQEVVALYHDLLINVTSFFRDPAVFEALKQQVYPAISENKSVMAPLRVWVPGCSTGQEAYTIAITLVEFFDDRPARPPIQIFATDLSDPPSLERARAGIYPEGIEMEVTPERLRRFFRKEDHVYRVEKLLRDMCVFARQNVTSDPPFSHVDLISCRNLLMYLSTPMQKRVLPILHYALNIPGYLVLGTAESVGENTELFEIIDRTHKIYAKKPALARPHVQYTSEDHPRAITPTVRQTTSAQTTQADYQREADRILLGRYAPPGVLVDENFEVLHFRGRTSLYLEQPAGEPTRNVLKMARDGLFLELRSALSAAVRQKQPVYTEAIRVRVDGALRTLDLEVIPVTPPGSGQPCYLILFTSPRPATAPLLRQTLAQRRNPPSRRRRRRTLKRSGNCERTWPPRKSTCNR